MRQTTKDKPHGVMKAGTPRKPRPQAELPFTKAEIKAVKQRYAIIDEKDYSKTEKGLIKKIKEQPPHPSPHNRGRPSTEKTPIMKTTKKTKKS